MASLSSKALENAIEQFATLPGIGRKTALRFALHMLRQNPEEVKRFADSLTALKTDICECKRCHNIADGDLCEICGDSRRDASTICVVENIKDILSIEATGQYRGLYHVLGGVISPVDGIGPSDLRIDSLIERASDPAIREVIFALRATIEGDTTGYYIYKKLPRRDEITVSTLAKGIAVGNDLEYTDELTLGRSIVNRVRFSM